MAILPRVLLPWRLWAPLWQRRLQWNGWFIPASTILLVIILLGLPYMIINQLMSQINWSVIDLSTTLDRSIPFIAWMIIPYFSLYFYYPAGALMAKHTDRGRRELIMLHQVLFLGSWIIFIFFILFPVEITLRDQIPIEIREGSGTWGWAYGGSLHLTDLPWNAWPSLHIFQSLLIVLTIDYWLKNDVFEASQLDNDNKRMGEMNNLKLILIAKRTTMWLMWVLLAVSVLFTKQHFVFDLLSGFAAGLFVWKYLLKPGLEWAKTDEAEEYTAKWE